MRRGPVNLLTGPSSSTLHALRSTRQRMHIIFEIDQGVARLTLNRPDVLNSFNRAMARELSDALASIATNDSVRAVLLTGAGRGFCAGQDLAEAAPRPDGSLPDLGDFVREGYNPIIRAIRTL